MGNFAKKLAELNDTRDHTDKFDARDVSDHRAVACIAYLGWLVLIPIFAAKESKYARFHSNQGLILAILDTVIAVVLLIIGAILSDVPVIGFLFGVLRAVILFALIIPSVLGVVNAGRGRAKELPIIGFLNILR